MSFITFNVALTTLSNRKQHTAFGKLPKVAANCRIRVAGQAKFRTRQELPSLQNKISERPISHQLATRSALERIVWYKSLTFSTIPVKLTLPATPSRQVVNVRDCINCVLIIVGSPEFHPDSRNPSQTWPGGTARSGQF